MDFSEKTVIITGAAAGIGRAAAMKFAELGAKVAAADIDEKKLEKLSDELSEYRILTINCDISDETAVGDMVQKVEKEFGKADILVNNAAIWRSAKPFEEISDAEWRRYLDINIMGAVYCTKAVLTGMLKRGYGKIINIASVAGVYGNAGMAHYSATKGAVIAMTKALAKETADKGVTVNCISPGSVSPADNPDPNYYESSELSFMGRTGTDRENANLICFLASDDAAYIDGQNIQIDGCRKKQ